MTRDEQLDAAEKAMAEAGAAAGKSAGGWIADGNTSDASLRALLRMWEDGDPAAPSAPDPFSGEWAGDPSGPETIAEFTDIDPDDLEPEEESDLLSAFEDAYRDAWHAEAERTVRALLGE